MANGDEVVRLSEEEARRLAELSPEAWARLDAMTDEDIAQQIAENPDAAPDLGDPAVRRERGLDLDVAAVRKGIGLSQRAFVELFDVGLGTLRDWEQGRRAPTGLARALLRMLAAEPQVTLALWRRASGRSAPTD